MKRLSVRLSVIATVLALGGAAIAYKTLSGGEGTAANQEQVAGAGKKAASRKKQAAPPPIRVTSSDTRSGESPAGKTLQPPPPSFFEGNQVNHLSGTDGVEEPKTATPIPTNDPAGGGFPASTTDDRASEQLPQAITDSSAGDLPAAPPAIAPPPGPGYGGLPPDPNGTTDSLNSNAAVDTTGRGSDPPPPGTGFALSDGVPAGATAPPTTSFPADGTPAGLQSPTFDGNSSGSFPESVADSTTSSAPIAQTPAGADNPASRLGQNDPAGSTTSAAAGLAGEMAGGAVAGLAAAGVPPASNPAGASTPRPTGRDEYPSTTPPDTYSGGPAPDGSFATPPPAASPASAGAFPQTGGGYATTDAGSQVGRSTTLPGSHYTAGDTSVDPSGPAAVMASNLPGDRQWEGQQSPAIVIEKSAPAEIQVNRKATFQVRVRNQGNATAHNVTVVDSVPAGTQFIDATPPVTPTANGTLVWQIAAIKPGEDVILSMNLLPQTAGEIGSVAQATFQTVASVRTICTKPELKLDVTVPEQVLIGQPAALEITITNIGNGAAEKVLIEEDVPEGFTHAAGHELEHDIGNLRPQESRRLTLVLDSAKAGTFQNHMTVRAEGDLFVEDTRPVQITSPQLQIDMQGPSLRYLDRQATYTVHLANPGTASARTVELVTYLPKGMKYVTSDNQGQYDTQSHAVYWSLEELPPNKQGDVHVTVLPIEAGSHRLKTDVKAELGLAQACEQEVVVEGLAELSFVVSDVADPIEVGSDTTYEIKVQNRGSKADTNIQLVAELPPGITPSTGDGPAQATVQGQSVVFAPLAHLGPNEEAVFKIRARGAAIGDHVIRVQLRSDELRVPVTKEEITRVYSDN